MKRWIQFLLCLILGMHFCILPAQAQGTEDAGLETMSQLAWQQLNLMQILGRLQSSLEHCRLKAEALKQEKQAESLKVQGLLIQSQKGSLDWLQEAWMEQKADFVLELEKKAEGWQRAIALLEQGMEDILKQLTEVEESMETQRRQHQKESSGFPEFVMEGQPDPEKLLVKPVSSDLAIGATVFGYSFGQACGLYGSYSLGSGSGSWSSIGNGSLSAGTWAYPSGGLHLGMDWASALLTPIMAPADGLILYADAPADTNGGYLGNYCGWPLGGGNTIAMICQVNGKLYGVTFAHLSSQIYVSAGQQVKASDIIALSGNSGNSTGPHTHIEVFELNVSLDQAVSLFSHGADFSFGTGWSQPAACSSWACQLRPEDVLFS